MIQGRRAAPGRDRICIHLTLTPKIFPSPLAALGTSYMLHAYSQSALLHRAFIWEQEKGQLKSCWPGVEVSLRVISCVILGKLLYLPDLPHLEN